MPHRYLLKPDECDALQTCISAGGELAERARLVQALHGCGRVTEVAENCYCDPRVVRKWFQRFRHEGVLGLEDRKRSGRPRRVNHEGLSSLLKHIDEASDYLTLRQFSSSIGVPTSTIHRALSAVGLTFHSAARCLWQQLGNEPSGWMELKGLAVNGRNQVLVFRYHPTMDLNELVHHHENGGVGCCRHGLLGDPVRLFEVSDREHATLYDDAVSPFATMHSWLQQLMRNESQELRCLAWRPHREESADFNQLANEYDTLQVQQIDSRRDWACLVNPLFLYEKRGSSRVRPIARCWWRLTEAALHALPTIQWSPGASRQTRQFSHYSGDYFPRTATSETDVNDLFQSLLVTQEVDLRRLHQDTPDENWERTMLGTKPSHK